MVSAQITGTSSMNNMLSSAGSVNTKSKGNDSAMDFSKVMSSHTKLTSGQDFSKIQNAVKPANENADKIKVQDKTEVETKVDNTITDKKEGNVKAESKKDGSTEVKEEVTQAVEQITEEIKSKLELTDEQLEELLAQLGMTVADLTDNANLTKLVAAAMGEDSFSLLTNEAFVNNLNDLSAFIANVVEETATRAEVEPTEVVKLFNEVVEENNVKKEPQQELKEAKVDLADKIEIVNLTTDSAVDNKSAGFEQDAKQDLSKNAEHKTDATTIAGELSQSVGEVFTEIIGDEMITVDGTDIVRQVIDAVKVTNTNELTSMEIALNPENLGKLNLTVVAKNGSITAQIVAENETVKRALEAQLTVLRTNLEQQGVKVDAVEVAVASHSFENNAGLEKGDQNNQQNGQSRRRGLNLSSLDDLENEELSPEELKIRQLLDDNSSVEYKA